MTISYLVLVMEDRDNSSDTLLMVYLDPNIFNSYSNSTHGITYQNNLDSARNGVYDQH